MLIGPTTIAIMSDESTSSPRLVRDLMTVGVLSCPPETPLSEVARLLLERELEGLVVLDETGNTIGVITHDEVVRGYASPGNTAALIARDVMRPDIPEVPPDIPLTAAAQLMQDLGVRIFFMMHHEMGIAWPAAILSYRHLLRHLAAEGEEDLRDMGIRAEREAPLDTFLKRRDAARQQNQQPDQE
jgi:CBS domain-containing protein